MKGRTRYLAGAVTIAILMGVLTVVVIMLPSGNTVTKVNFDRIEHGMTLEQVEEILGRSPDAVGPVIITEPGIHVYIWHGTDHDAIVEICEVRIVVLHKTWLSKSPQS